jgi:hypothetical protein
MAKTSPGPTNPVLYLKTDENIIEKTLFYIGPRPFNVDDIDYAVMLKNKWEEVRYISKANDIGFYGIILQLMKMRTNFAREEVELNFDCRRITTYAQLMDRNQFYRSQLQKGEYTIELEIFIEQEVYFNCPPYKKRMEEERVQYRYIMEADNLDLDDTPLKVRVEKIPEKSLSRDTYV